MAIKDDVLGQAALFTGPPTPLTITVARRLGNAGLRLAFAGPSRQPPPELELLLYQFRRSAICVDADPTDVAAMESAAEYAERRLGRVGLFFHTLGAASAEMPDYFGAVVPGVSSTSLARARIAPFLSALTCSRAAARHAARREQAHIVHLVTRADVGAAEVERRVLNALQEQREAAPVNFVMSAIYFEEIAPLLIQPKSVHASELREPRLLEQFTDRLLEEDAWIARVTLESEIGNLVMRVCTQTPSAAPGEVRSFDFHGPPRGIDDGSLQ